MTMEKPRIGVYVCWCGTNIAKMVDVEAVADEIGRLPNVVISKNYKYMCSDPGQDLIVKDIKEHQLNRIVVSACSPRIHELTFRKALEKAGLNPYLFEMANIREQDSWVHTDRAEATKKAKSLVAAAVNRVNFHEPLDARTVDINPSTLIIGGGIAGMSAALEIANAGKTVYLIEKSKDLGGHAAKLDLTFPYLTSAQQMMKPLIKSVKTNKNIQLFLDTEIKEIFGYIGNFETTIKKDGKDTKLKFGNIIVATGLRPSDASKVTNYGYGKIPDVITSLEFEEMLNKGKIVKKDGSEPKNVAIIHCVGSRNKEQHEYCSRTCCLTALKYANQLRLALPTTNIYELYADMRAMGKGCEELYAATSRQHVMFMMFDQQNDIPKIKQSKGKDYSMLIELNEKLSGEAVEIPTDMVILMTGMEAHANAKEIAHSVGISMDGNAFYIEKHPKRFIIATTTNGVYIVGGCQGPKDIPIQFHRQELLPPDTWVSWQKVRLQLKLPLPVLMKIFCCGCQK